MRYLGETAALVTAVCWASSSVAFGAASQRIGSLSVNWLRVAVDRGYINHPFLARYDPCLEQVRSEPRFQQLLELVRERWRSFEP